jgi:hypothetical protein
MRKPTPEITARIVAGIESDGLCPHDAAEQAGIDNDTFGEWCYAGWMAKDALPNPFQRGGGLYGEFLDAIFDAVPAGARVKPTEGLTEAQAEAQARRKMA